MDDINKFKVEVAAEVEQLGQSKELQELGMRFVKETSPLKYTYHFSWMGRPIIQFPQDMIAMQEIIWDVKPDLIIETGIAHGGSLIYYASLLQLLGKGRVLGIDIDIRSHNRKAIEEHPMIERIDMLEGSSTDPVIVEQVREAALGASTILVALDSNHTHEHVLRELEAYAPLVTEGSYCVVFDTVVEHMPEGSYLNRPWSQGNNPKTAVLEFLQGNDDFVIDKSIQHKLLITMSPDGYLKRIKQS